MEDRKINRAARIALPAAAIAIVAIMAFWPFLDAPFLLDDLHTIRDNPHLARTLDPSYFFRHPESASSLPSTMIRPALTFTYAIDRHLNGENPFGYHLTNLLLHLACALLVAALTRKTELRPLWWMAGLLFLLLPINTTLVAYASNRSTLLSSAFYLAAMYSFARAWERPASITRTAPAAALVTFFFAAGLFSKSVASTLPAAIVLWALAFPAGGPNPDDNRDLATSKKIFAVIVLSLAAAVLVLYFWYRAEHAAPSFFPATRPWPVWAYAASGVRSYFTYLRLMALPEGLSAAHEAWVPRAPGDLASPGFAAATISLAALLTLGIYLLKKSPALGFAILFSALYLLPTSSVVPLVLPINENRPYLSALAVIWPLLMAIEAARSRPRTAWAIAAAIPVLLFLLLRNRSPVYHSEMSVWKDAARQAPGLAITHVNMGLVYKNYGRFDKAAKSFGLALKADPCSASAWNNLGNLSYAQGDLAGAEQNYRRAMGCDPSSGIALFNLGSLLMETGRPEEGLSYLERAASMGYGRDIDMR